MSTNQSRISRRVAAIAESATLAVDAKTMTTGVLTLAASTLSAALLNLVAAALVLVGPSRMPVQPESLPAKRPPAKRHPAKGDSEVSAPPDRNAWPFVLAAFLISAASFSLEVFWARLLSHLLGGTMQGFASMLCVTLLGIGAGGILAQRSTRLAADGRRWLILSLVVAAVGQPAGDLRQ